MRFEDRRGKEGDDGDPMRVGGVYGGYGNRLFKIMVNRPWPPDFHNALVAEFRAQGVDARLIDGAPKRQAGLFVLEGEIRNFSTESRWSQRAHISGIVRLTAPDGQRVVEKEIRAVERGGMGSWSASDLEQLLGAAFRRFVKAIATERQIVAALEEGRRFSDPNASIVDDDSFEARVRREQLRAIEELKVKGTITAEEAERRQRAVLEGK